MEASFFFCVSKNILDYGIVNFAVLANIERSKMEPEYIELI